MCAEGSFLNDDNECEKRREKKPVASRDTDQQNRPAQKRPPQASTKSAYGAGGTPARGGSGQIYCDYNSCRPVARGCHLEYRGGGGINNIANPEVCN